MAAPSFSLAVSPVKLIQSFLAYLGFTNAAKGEVSGLTQLVFKIGVMLGLLPPAGVSITTAGAGTYTGAQLAEGLIKRDPSGAARTDTTDTAANILLAFGAALGEDYQQVFVTLVNTADAAETITLAGGSGVTLKGAITVERYCAIRLAIMRTSSTTVCIRQV